jgi:cob(II)yrinic acid a,c-diamide reductase
VLTMPHLDAADYRNAMARYAGHVQIVTTAMDGQRRGVTITAACSVSDNPATVLCCLNHSNPNNQIFLESGIFALNTLAAHHRPLADAFAGFGKLDVDARFALGHWDQLVTGAPVLQDAIASYDCRIVDVKQMSTHSVLFGEVVGLRTGVAAQSLVYLDRAYHIL